MKKNILLPLFLLFTLGSLIGQNKNENRNIVLKWNISALADYTPSLQFGIQYHLVDKFHLQHEIGYISHYFSPYWSPESELGGLRIKNTIKYYLPTFTRKVPIYFGFDLLYKRIKYLDSRQYSMYNDSYFQMIDIERTKTVYAGTIILGFEPFIIEDKLFLDFYAGLGYRHLIIEDSTPPDNGIETSRNNMFRRNEGIFNMPNIALGLRLGFMINGKKKSETSF